MMSGVSPVTPPPTTFNKTTTAQVTFVTSTVPTSATTSLALSSTSSLTSRPALTETTPPYSCPPLRTTDRFQDGSLLLSTNDTKVGTVVTANCKPSWVLVGPTHLLCNTSGAWNGTKPTCISEGSLAGLITSHQVLIAVFAGCAALVFFVICVICCHLVCSRKSARTNTEDRVRQQAQSGSNHYATPKGVSENHYQSSDVTRLHYATPDVTPNRPEIYNTFSNPSFYEESYERWRLEEQARHDRTYDAPWQYSRRLQHQMDNPELKWSTATLRALDSYDYKNHSHIPRGRVSSESETDYAESTTTDTHGLTTF